MKPSTKRTLKKVFLNICAGLFALVFTGNIIAGENAGQINQVLGTKTSMTVSTAPAGTEEGYSRYFDSKYNSIAELKAAGEAKVREVEGEGIVLLKNEGGVLPLAAGSKVSLVGVTVMDPVYGGTGSGAVDANGAPNYLDVMKGAGFEVVDEPLLNYYVENEQKRDAHAMNELNWKKSTKNSDDTLGNGEDAIYVIGRVGGEGDDVTAEKEDAMEREDNGRLDYLQLNEDERKVLLGLKEYKDDGKIRSITVIINSANPVSTDFLYDEEYGVDAALWVGSVGQTGLYAVGDVISGAVNPSGSLPDTWWMDNYLDPVMNNFGAYNYAGADGFGLASSAYTRYVVYQEGVYVGYKYAETRYEDVVMGTPKAGSFDYDKVVSFPFGFGLSYSTFSFTDMQVARSGEGMEAAYTVAVKVTNTGSAAGKKTVQIYAQKPYTDYDRQNQIEKPAVELVGYGKTAVLQPGESETVTVTVPEYYLTSYDALGTGAYILAEGTHYLTAAENAHAAVNQILAQKGFGEADTSLVYGFEQAFDSTTYAKAYGTGAEVKSLFADVDMNRYEGKGSNSITWYSRSDWEGTVTAGPVQLTMTEQIAADVVLDDKDLPDATGVEFPTMGKNADLQLINMREYAADDPMWETFMDQLTWAELSAVTLTGLRETVSVPGVGKPGTIDHNGPSGVTQKYSIGANGYATVNNDPNKDMKGTCYPCNGIIAATFNDKLVEEVGELIGEDAMWAGYAGLYGTGLNIHRSPYAGRVFEYYSEDGMLTGLIDTAETRGIQSRGVYVYNKHFVCNDQENNRAGIGTWMTEQALREHYLRAFELPIVNADAKCVMTGYNRLGANWCGAYSELLLGWLRGEAGMKGVAVSDMYDASYMVPVHEIVAGNDIPDGELDAALLADYAPGAPKANAAVAQAMRQSAKLVMQTVVQSRGMDGISQYTKVVRLTPWWQTALNVAQWTLLGLSVIALALLALDILKEKKAK